jgi:hypothetical protein
MDAAERYCEAKAALLPHVRYEVYDMKGIGRPPLLVVVHPGFVRKENSGSIGRRIIIAVLLAACVPLFVAGTHESGFRDLAIFLGINCILTSLRLLYWEIGARRRESERRQRLDAHRRQERGVA